MKINVENVMSRLEELYLCGKQGDGTYTRMAYSREDVRAREIFRGYFDKLGIGTRVDAAGNIIARLEGKNSALPCIMMGSHLDTVPDGGRYDGVLGCVAALGVCEALVQEKRSLNHPVEVVVFTDEEGFRFGNGLLGSSAICGADAHVSDDDEDLYGDKRSDVMQSYNITAAKVTEARRAPSDVHCFLELHVEQGATLDRKKIPVGVVTSIAGVSRFDVRVDGEANHAGSTAMSDRKDALVAAADFIRQVPDVVAGCGSEFTVATVGTIKVAPNSVNVVPGSCDFSLEFRDQSAEVMRTLEKRLLKLLGEICEKHGTAYEARPVSCHAPAPMSDWVRDAVEDSAKSLGCAYMMLPSGAFHDSLIMTTVFPTGMIFVPSVNGISHSRYEQTATEDIEKGCEVLLRTVLKLDTM